MARLEEFDPHEKLDKAKELFGKKGYHATSMQDLVDNLQINRSSMYDTFGDKHKLFTDSLQSNITETLKDYKAIIPCGFTLMNTIKRMVFRAVRRAF